MEATRIAIVQVAPAFLDRAECLRIAVRAVAEAAAGGARLIGLPRGLHSRLSGLDLAIASYQRRERRFGRTSEQLGVAGSAPPPKRELA